MRRNRESNWANVSPIEQLENRTLLSVSLDGNGLLSVVGRASKDDLLISIDGADLVVKLNGATTTYALDAVKRITAHGKAGADRLVLASNVNMPAEIYGGAGADTIAGGEGDDLLVGGKGNDRIYGRNGDDRIIGEGGNDRLFGGKGIDSIWGGAGDDLMTSGAGDDIVHGGLGKNQVDRLDARAVAGGPIVKSRDASPTVVGYDVQQIWKGYGIDRLKSLYSGLYKTSKMGEGQIIAIVTPYHAPTLQVDLDSFSQQFKIPSTQLVVLNVNGQTPIDDPDWAMETTLDVERAHAMAPAATIVVVEADSDARDDMYDAVDKAVQTIKNPGGIVSLSWGEDAEFAGEVNLDVHFNNADTKNISFVVAAADVPAAVGYAESSPYVLGVGGTSLQLSNTGVRVAPETGWDDGGGGFSSIYTRPAFQNNVIINSVVPAMRVVPDIAFSANPNFGVAVFTSDPGITDTPGWYEVGGCSAAAPQIAGSIALANQLRKTRGLGLLGNKLQSEVYRLASLNYSATYNDIKSGGRATKGFDTSTGWGTPKMQAFVPGLAGIVTIGSGSTKFVWNGRVTDSMWTVPSSDRSRINWMAGLGAMSKLGGQRLLSMVADKAVMNAYAYSRPLFGAGVATADITVDTPLTYAWKGIYTAYGFATVTMTDGDVMAMNLKFSGKLRTVNGKQHFYGHFFTVNGNGKRLSQGVYPIFEGDIE